MGYSGVYVPGVINRNKLINLLREGGVTVHTLDELLITLTCVLISHRTKAATLSRIESSFMTWTDEHNCALELVPLEARYDYVISCCLDHEQTQLSS